MTVPLVSTSSSAPIPLPMQVPQGHVVQQIVDENGTLRHVIVSQQPPLIPMPNYVSPLILFSIIQIGQKAKINRGQTGIE